MTLNRIRPALTLVLVLTGWALPLRAVEVHLGGVGGEVDLCDNTARTSTWTNTTGQTIYMRSMELRQVTTPRTTPPMDILATLWVVRNGVSELLLADNWPRVGFIPEAFRASSTSLAPDYVAVTPGDELRFERRCVMSQQFSPVTHAQQILYFRFATTLP